MGQTEKKNYLILSDSGNDGIKGGYWLSTLKDATKEQLSAEIKSVKEELVKEDEILGDTLDIYVYEFVGKPKIIKS